MGEGWLDKKTCLKGGRQALCAVSFYVEAFLLLWDISFSFGGLQGMKSVITTLKHSNHFPSLL